MILPNHSSEPMTEIKTSVESQTLILRALNVSGQIFNSPSHKENSFNQIG
jgi:hypothetical protein